MKKVINEIGSLVLLIIAVALAIVLYPFGILYSLLLKPLYHIFWKKDPAYTGKKWLRYFGYFFYQIWNVIKMTFYYIAYLIDVLGNALVGELIEDIVTPKEDTWLGKGDRTISVAMGKLEQEAKEEPALLNGRGRFLIRVLDKFEKNHCDKAIRRWNFNQKLKEED